MTQVAWLVLAAAAAFAVADWLAVALGRVRWRWVSKPGTILLLIAVALNLHPAVDAQRYVFVAALLLSLLGDVVLLAADTWFRVGLAAFLAAHVAFAAGFLAGGVDRLLLGYALAAVAIVSLVLGARIVGAILRAPDRTLALPATGYLLAISAMVALAAASGRPVALAGAALFYVSDGMIAWNRFVHPLRWSALPVIVTYQLGQAGLVLSLAT